jgi:antitoxin FitA
MEVRYGAGASRPAGGLSGPTCDPCTRMYYACMPNVQVRDVPDEVHEALVRRAEQAGQSLQQFLASQLAAIAATPTMEEILDRIERRPKGELSAKAAIDALDEERARR